MSWRDILGHPAGLALLAASAVLAGIVASLPAAADWSDRAPKLLLLGAGAFAACAAVVFRWPASALELRRVRAARREIARILADRRGSLAEAHKATWDRLTSEALLRLDEEIVPALVQLLARRAGLARHVTAYQDARRSPPDPALLEELRGTENRQQLAITLAVRQVVNAEATLIAVVQEMEDIATLTRLESWLGDLAGLHDELVNTLIEHSRPPEPDPILDAQGELPRAAPEISPTEPSPLPTPPADPDRVTADNQMGRSEQPILVEMVREALGRLNKPANLARSPLVGHLPRTLRAVRSGSGEPVPSEATPLEASQALRGVLLAAIERLKAGDREAADQPLQYRILLEEYVEGKSTKHIMVRHAISESTLHRRRQEGIAAVAAELATRESRLSERRDPVAMDYLG